MTAALELEAVSVSYPRPGWFRSAPLDVLLDVSLSVPAASTVALVGESGSGKSTLARAVFGLAPIRAGRVRLAGAPVDHRDAASLGALRRAAALMFQDPIASLSPRLTVKDLVLEPRRIHGVTVRDAARESAELLARVSLPADLVERYPHELSGGQARRIGVARALSLSPRLIVADEPTAGLDVSVQGDVLNLLYRLQREQGLSILLITHNLAVVRHVSDRVVVLYMGRVVESGWTSEVFGAPRHPYTRALLLAEPRPDPGGPRPALAVRGEVPSLLRRPTGCEFHPRCAAADATCRTSAPPLHGGAGQVRCHHPQVGPLHPPSIARGLR